MSLIMIVLIGIGLLVLGFVGVIVYGIIHAGKPTSGKQIEPYAQPQNALLVIDIQEDYTGTTAKPPLPYKNSERLIAIVNQAIEAASQKNFLIVYIRQEFDTWMSKMASRMLFGGTAIKGAPGAQIDARINMLSNHVFSKPIGDAFSNPELEAFLIEQRVNTLYLVGLDGAACVDRTAKGALNRGYNITIITDAVVTRFEKQWQSFLKQYPQKGIMLLSSQEFLATN